MPSEKRVRAANQLISLSSLADESSIIRAQDQNFNNCNWDDFYKDSFDDQRILLDVLRAILFDEAGCDLAALRHLHDYDREAVVHGLQIAYTSKEGIENG
jgi:hypothetical protein